MLDADFGAEAKFQSTANLFAKVKESAATQSESALKSSRRVSQTGRPENERKFRRGSQQTKDSAAEFLGKPHFSSSVHGETRDHARKGRRGSLPQKSLWSAFLGQADAQKSSPRSFV